MKIKRISIDDLLLIAMLIMFFISILSLYETRKLSHKIDSFSKNAGIEELVKELNEENNHGELK